MSDEKKLTIGVCQPIVGEDLSIKWRKKTNIWRHCSGKQPTIFDKLSQPISKNMNHFEPQSEFKITRSKARVDIVIFNCEKVTSCNQWNNGKCGNSSYTCQPINGLQPPDLRDLRPRPQK